MPHYRSHGGHIPGLLVPCTWAAALHVGGSMGVYHTHVHGPLHSTHGYTGTRCNTPSIGKNTHNDRSPERRAARQAQAAGYGRITPAVFQTLCPLPGLDGINRTWIRRTYRPLVRRAGMSAEDHVRFNPVSLLRVPPSPQTCTVAHVGIEGPW